MLRIFTVQQQKLERLELQIYSEDDQPLLQVKPQAGTMVLFESARFPHEVLAAHSTRYSIAGWFRID